MELLNKLFQFEITFFFAFLYFNIRKYYNNYVVYNKRVNDVAKKINLSFKKPNFDKKTLQKLYKQIGIIGILIGFVLLCFSIYYIVYDINRNNNAVTTKARVKQVDFNGEQYVLSISYDVQNQEYTNTYIYDAESVTINEFIEIRYNRKNPSDIITTNHMVQIITITPLAILFLTISIIYVVGLKKKEKRLKTLKEQGIHILADIEGIFANSNAKKKKGKLPYHIKAQYINPQDGKTYTYVSEDYYEDLLMLTSSKVITKVPVYINPKNTSDYYMDLVYILPEDNE